MTVKLITQEEAAEILRTSVRTIYNLRKAGAFPYLPGSPILLREDDIDLYIRRSMVRDKPPPCDPKMEEPASIVGREIGLDFRASRLKAEGRLEEAAAAAAEAKALRAQFPRRRRKPKPPSD